MCSLFGLPPKKRQHISARKEALPLLKQRREHSEHRVSSLLLLSCSKKDYSALVSHREQGASASAAEEPWPDAPGKQGFHPMSPLSLKKKKNLCKKALIFFRNKVVKSPFLPPWSPGQQPCPVPLLASSVLAKAKETLNGPFKRQHDREGNERWLVLLFWGIFFLRYNSILT